jgi:hypothetical protein
MTAIQFALVRAHNKNIDRYHRLLKSHLSDVECHYVKSRLTEEEAALQAIERNTASADAESEVVTADKGDGSGAKMAPVGFSEATPAERLLIGRRQFVRRLQDDPSPKQREELEDQIERIDLTLELLGDASSP